MLRSPQYYSVFRTRPLLSQPALPRSLVTLVLSAVFCAALLTLLWGPLSGGEVPQWLPFTSRPKVPGIVLEPDGDGFYEWHGKSAFDPVRQYNAASKTPNELCAAFPTHLLDDIQPVLKTGHRMLEERLRIHLNTVSACLTNLLIFSDTGEVFADHETIDVIADIPTRLTDRPKGLRPWRNGALASGSAPERAGWIADKYKFLPALSRAWRMPSNKKWFFFFEDDTYIVWDSVFRLLENYDPDDLLYFGSPTPGDEGTWFANGGPGFILSRGALRKFGSLDWDSETGEYLGPQRTEEWWDVLTDGCCGDSTLGWALWWQNITIGGLYPMFNPLFGDVVSFSDRHWCQPVLAMHADGQMDDFAQMWQWEWENRELDRPLLYRDLALTYFDFANLQPRDHWDNAQRDSFIAPPTSDPSSPGPHTSADACQQACETHDECFQWTYHLRRCRFVRAMRFGQRQEPGFTQYDRDQGWFYTWGWGHDDRRFRAGWNNLKIRKWIYAHPCDTVQWVKPSTRRIY